MHNFAIRLTPTFETFLSVLSLEGLSSNKKRYLRLRAWWAGNDSRRKKPIAMSVIERENILALGELLDETNSNDLIMKAEIYREAEDFEKAKALLEKIETTDLVKAVAFMKKHIEQKDPFVRKLVFE